jgi:serine/threonine protein kinase
MTTQPSDPFGLVGQTLARKYHIEACVGEGGFAVVYRAQHASFKKPVAVKCLKVPPHFTPEAQKLFLQRFEEEGQRLYQLSEHPAIVKVLDFDVTERGVPYLVLEWLEGRDLEAILAASDETLSEEEAIDLLRSAVEALAFAHALGIAHRDVKQHLAERH